MAEYILTFSGDIDQEVRVPVIEYIGDRADEFVDGEVHLIETKLVTFDVKRLGNTFYIGLAKWNRDMIYVSV